MSQPRSFGNRLAVVMVGIGFTVALFGGLTAVELQRTQYDYHLSTVENKEFYAFEALPTDAQTALRRSLNASGGRVTHDESLSTFEEGTAHYVRDGNDYYCVEVETRTTLVVERNCPFVTTTGPVVHDYANLSTEAKRIVERALAESDGELTVHRDSPPEFDRAGDTYTVNDGLYVIAHEGDEYRLSVSRQGGLAQGLETMLAVFGTVVGGVIALFGLVLYRRTPEG